MAGFPIVPLARSGHRFRCCRWRSRIHRRRRRAQRAGPGGRLGRLRPPGAHAYRRHSRHRHRPARQPGGIPLAARGRARAVGGVPRMAAAAVAQRRAHPRCRRQRAPGRLGVGTGGKFFAAGRQPRRGAGGSRHRVGGAAVQRAALRLCRDYEKPRRGFRPHQPPLWLEFARRRRHRRGHRRLAGLGPASGLLRVVPRCLAHRPRRRQRHAPLSLRRRHRLGLPCEFRVAAPRPLARRIAIAGAAAGFAGRGGARRDG